MGEIILTWQLVVCVFLCAGSLTRRGGFGEIASFGVTMLLLRLVLMKAIQNFSDPNTTSIDEILENFWVRFVIYSIADFCLLAELYYTMRARFRAEMAKHRVVSRRIEIIKEHNHE